MDIFQTGTSIRGRRIVTEERDCQTIAYPSPINSRMVRLLLPVLCLEREKVAWKDVSLLQNQIYRGFVPIRGDRSNFLDECV